MCNTYIFRRKVPNLSRFVPSMRAENRQGQFHKIFQEATLMMMIHQKGNHNKAVDHQFDPSSCRRCLLADVGNND
jgi:hypothetical protein